MYNVNISSSFVTQFFYEHNQFICFYNNLFYNLS